MRPALPAASSLLALLAASALVPACSSWDTGTPDTHAPERACLDTVTALAKAGERCGLEYRRVYDQQLTAIAGGDCKNVTGIRDERALREECLPSLASEPCESVIAGEHDESCSTQLKRAL